MKKFKDTFHNWVDKKVDYQLDAIDKICSEIEVDVELWFKNHYLGKNAGDYSGTQILEDMLENFIYFLGSEFENSFLKFVKPKGYNIYKEPYLAIEFELKYKNNELFIKDKHKENIIKFCEQLTLEQKAELMENKLFSYIVNKTNLEFLSKKEMRFLKLKNLDEYKSTISQ